MGEGASSCADRSRILAAGNVDKLSSIRRIKRSLPQLFAPKTQKREELSIEHLGASSIYRSVPVTPSSMKSHSNAQQPTLIRQCRSSFTGSLKNAQPLPLDETFAASEKLRKKRSMPQFTHKSLDLGQASEQSKSASKDGSRSRRSSRQRPPPLPSSPHSPPRASDKSYPPRATMPVPTASRASSLRRISRQSLLKEPFPPSPCVHQGPISPASLQHHTVERRSETHDAGMSKRVDKHVSNDAAMSKRVDKHTSNDAGMSKRLDKLVNNDGSIPKRADKHASSDVFSDVSLSMPVADIAALKGWKVVRQSRLLLRDAEKIEQLQGSKPKHEAHCPLARALDDPWKLVEKAPPPKRKPVQRQSRIPPPKVNDFLSACPVHEAGAGDSYDSESLSLHDQIWSPADLNAWLNMRFSLVGESLPSLTDGHMRCSLASEDRDRQPYTMQRTVSPFLAHGETPINRATFGPGLPRRRGPLFDNDAEDKEVIENGDSPDGSDDEWTISQCYHLAAKYIEASDHDKSGDNAAHSTMTKGSSSQHTTRRTSFDRFRRHKGHSPETSISAGSVCASFLSADSEPADLQESFTISAPETPRESRPKEYYL